jgi:hypothetical protein
MVSARERPFCRQYYKNTRNLREELRGAVDWTEPWIARLALVLVLDFWPVSTFLGIFNIKLPYSTTSESLSYVTTDGQSASLSSNKAPIWGLKPDFHYCLQ